MLWSWQVPSALHSIHMHNLWGFLLEQHRQLARLEQPQALHALHLAIADHEPWSAAP